MALLRIEEAVAGREAANEGIYVGVFDPVCGEANAEEDTARAMGGVNVRWRNAGEVEARSTGVTLLLPVSGERQNAALGILMRVFEFFGRLGGEMISSLFGASALV